MVGYLMITLLQISCCVRKWKNLENCSAHNLTELQQEVCMGIFLKLTLYINKQYTTLIKCNLKSFGQNLTNGK